MQEDQNRGVTPGNSSFLLTEELLHKSRLKNFSVFSPQVGGDPGPAHRADRRPVIERFPETLASPSEQLGSRIATGTIQERPGVNPQSQTLESVQRIERSLILKNLPLHVDKLEIWQALTEFGVVEQISKLRRSNPQSMFCYVTMQDVRDALMLQESGYFIFRGRRKVHVEKFVPKCERPKISSKPSRENLELESLVAAGWPSKSHSFSSFHRQLSVAVPQATGKNWKIIGPDLVEIVEHDTERSFSGKNICLVQSSRDFIKIRPGLQIIANQDQGMNFKITGTPMAVIVQTRDDLNSTDLKERIAPTSNLRFNISCSGLCRP